MNGTLSIRILNVNHLSEVRGSIESTSVLWTEIFLCLFGFQVVLSAFGGAFDFYLNNKVKLNLVVGMFGMVPDELGYL